MSTLEPITSFQGRYRFLSNFSGSIIIAEGLTFPSAEHLYQASKCVNERDILRFVHHHEPYITAGQAKRLGRQIQIRSDWDEIKLDVMRHITQLKFDQNPGYRQLLLDTGDRELIEGNTWGDTFWGVCNGVGENHLGRILMTVRGLLR